MALGLLGVLALSGAHAAFAATGGGHDALLPVLEALVLVLLAARLGGALFLRLGMPSVLGELVAGAALAALARSGLHAFDRPDTRLVLDTLAQLGAVFLLFRVGLETEVSLLASVGRSATLAAVIGVGATALLGYGVAAWLDPGREPLVHAFVGATLAATSVGLTARVLSDLGRAASREGHTILAAAVVDDVFALVVLAALTGMIGVAGTGQAFSAGALLAVVGKALLFLVGSALLGRLVSRRAFALADRLRGEGLLMTMSVAFCFTLSWLAGVAGLAPIVGAFAAGLVLDEATYRVLLDREARARSIDDLLEPVAQLFVPVFFVLMGMAVDLSALLRPGVLGYAALLAVASVLGKQACGLGVLEKGTDRIAVGLGMIPRGEVTIIFASIGRTLQLNGRPVIDAATYSALVLVVVLTTLVAPPLLVARLRGSRAADAVARP